jgi:hypothetical protein
MINTQEDQIIEEICGYAEKYEIREMLQDYMRRLILEQPKEPLKWLIKEISEKPYPTPKHGTEGEVAATAAAEVAAEPAD